MNLTVYARIILKLSNKVGPIEPSFPVKPAVVPDVVLTCDRADWDKDKRLKPFMNQSPLIVFKFSSECCLS
jgi:hypothetical protein